MTVYTNLRIWDGVADDYAAFDSIAVEGDSIAGLGNGWQGADCGG